MIWTCSKCGLQFPLPQDAFPFLCRCGFRAETPKSKYTGPSYIPAKRTPVSLECFRRGDVTGFEECATCGGTVKIKVYSCSMHGKCTLSQGSVVAGVRGCGVCPDKQAVQIESIPSLKRGRIDSKKLLSETHSFNNSILRFNGRLLMAYRVGWGGAKIALVELNEAYVPVKSWKLEFHKTAVQEDPRLWVFRGRLYVSFSHYRKKLGVNATDVCYARLTVDSSGDWVVEEEFHPQYPGRQIWEKNWGFFENRGDLYAVYSISPHVILRIDGNTALEVSRTENRLHDRGMLRGGSPPFLFQGEYYSWYHSVQINGTERTYTTDLYTFEDKFPFRPLRYVPEAILRTNPQDRPEKHIPHVVFPGGAFVDQSSKWVISLGYYDSWCEYVWWDLNHVEEALIPIVTGPLGTLSYSKEDAGLRVWKQVALGNEYRLPDRMDGQVVVDVGTHIGSFAHACLIRGAAHVICCEPTTASIAHARHNLAAYKDRVSFHNSYIIARADTDLMAQYAATLTQDKNATLLTIRDLVSQFDMVDLLKLDCEGPEHEIAERSDLSNVRRVVGEVHRVRDKGIDTFVAAMDRQGFRTVWERSGDGLWNFWSERIT